MTSVDPTIYTPYSTIRPLISSNVDPALWAPEEERERIQAYQKYEEIYWSHTEAFKMVQRGTEEDLPIYIPNPRTICDTTAFFYLKGVRIHIHSGGEGAETTQMAALEQFTDREAFFSKFHEAKHSGVVRGDYLLHMTGDPAKAPGTRVSINSVDPAMYFPELDSDNLDRVLAVNLVEQIFMPEDPLKPRIRWLRYQYASSAFPNDPQMAFSDPERVVVSQEGIWEVDGWWKGKEAKRLVQIRPLQQLPSPIRTIPVYHFKNIPWQGHPYGSSELRGYEMVQAGVNQGISDEALALSLEGLGVYATDSGPPVDEQGNETAWTVSPGRVLEIATGAIFKRVEGVPSVKPWQDHFQFLTESMYEASGTFRGGSIEAQVAESGIALAIKFLPTQAKLEERDEYGIALLRQWTFDWMAWQTAYEEGFNFNENLQIEIVLGDKLPINKTDILNLLNNMVDRNAISKKFYREELGKAYDLVYPADMDAQIQAEAQEAMQAAIERAAKLSEATGTPTPPGTPGSNGNKSNNKDRPNESAGTESTQSTDKQTRV